MNAVNEVLTLGDVAEIFGIRLWKVRRLFERGFLSEPKRVGGYRIVFRADLPIIEQALREAGYLSASAAGKSVSSDEGVAQQ